MLRPLPPVRLFGFYRAAGADLPHERGTLESHHCRVKKMTGSTAAGEAPIDLGHAE